jgi:PAS domain S-box-containing protein
MAAHKGKTTGLIFRLERQPKGLLFLAGLILDVVVGFLDYSEGSYVGMEIFYLLPISVVSWAVGRNAGILMSVIATASLVAADVLGLREHHPVIIVNPLAHFGMFLVFAWLLSGMKTALLESEERQNILESILESAGEGICGINKNGHHILVNKAALRILGHDEQNILGKHSHEIWHHKRADGTPYQEEDCNIYATLCDGTVRRIKDEVFWRKDGSSLPVEYTVAPLLKEGAICGAVLVFRDITERLRAEEEIAQLNRRLGDKISELEDANKDLEALIYAVSHDLRAPLRSISGFARFIMEDYGDRLDGQGRDYLSRMNRGAIKIGRLIEDLLSLSRASRQEINRTTLDMSKMASSIVSELRASDPSRAVATDIAGGISARGDEKLTGVALSNLIGNAWKFTSKTKDARIEFGEVRENGRKTFFVRDNGAGFEARHKEKMFLPFHRLHSDTEFEGTGIGLAIVQRVIHRQGGDIWAEGAVGMGATFYFRLEE